jgi:hypothetical protein
MLYGIVQWLTLWDVQVLAGLEGWQREVGSRARAWLAALGEAEALAALAVPAHDHPDWAFPTFDPATGNLEAQGLGHPLLPDAVRVVNDVTVGPPGTLLLVTGSNMSGKSTLLRALGVNIVLAGAGGPVCAAALRLPPVTLWTSMRVRRVSVGLQGRLDLAERGGGEGGLGQQLQRVGIGAEGDGPAGNAVQHPHNPAQEEQHDDAVGNEKDRPQRHRQPPQRLGQNRDPQPGHAGPPGPDERPPSR